MKWDWNVNVSVYLSTLNPTCVSDSVSEPTRTERFPTREQQRQIDQAVANFIQEAVSQERLLTPEEIQEFENMTRARILGAIPPELLPHIRVSAATQTTPTVSRAVSPTTTANSASVTTSTTSTSSRTSVLPPQPTGSSTSGTASLSTRRSNVPPTLRISHVNDGAGFSYGPLTGSDSPLTKDSDRRFFGSDSDSTDSRRGGGEPRQPTVLLPDDAGQFFQRGTTPSGTIAPVLLNFPTF